MSIWGTIGSIAAGVAAVGVTVATGGMALPLIGAATPLILGATAGGVLGGLVSGFDSGSVVKGLETAGTDFGVGLLGGGVAKLGGMALKLAGKKLFTGIADDIANSSGAQNMLSKAGRVIRGVATGVPLAFANSMTDNGGGGGGGGSGKSNGIKSLPVILVSDA